MLSFSIRDLWELPAREAPFNNLIIIRVTGDRFAEEERERFGGPEEIIVVEDREDGLGYD